MEAIKTLFLLITLSFFCSCIEADSFGFTVDLIHRDSIFSPYFNPSNTHYENLRNSVRHAVARSNNLFTQRLASSGQTIDSPLTPVPGSYLMKISVGTPPLDLLAVADTGSDLVWTQCQPCMKCYKQESPLFDPRKSSSYKNQPCESDACQSFSQASCDGNKCTYATKYGDDSFSRGDLSSESFTFKSTSGNAFVVPNILFGCGHFNGGGFGEQTTGIVGLGTGKLSMVNQLSDTIKGKFSYCMVPLGARVTSKVTFGSNAVVSGPGVVTTPFFTQDTDPFYYLNLESISVGGGTKMKYNTNKYSNYKASVGDGNIIIDSGTTVTFLPSDIYQQFINDFQSSTSLTPARFTGAQGNFGVCYTEEEGFEEKVPTVTFHFSGADLDLGLLNTMQEVAEGVVCLTILPADEGKTPIFGNMQQMNHLVRYDLVSKTVSFKKTDCTVQ